MNPIAATESAIRDKLITVATTRNVGDSASRLRQMLQTNTRFTAKKPPHRSNHPTRSLNHSIQSISALLYHFLSLVYRSHRIFSTSIQFV